MNTELLHLRHDQIQPGANIRDDVGDITELAASVLGIGLQEPMIVKPNGSFNDRYTLVAGERRWTAIGHLIECAAIKKSTTWPCIVRNYDDGESTATMIVENLHRKDLDPIEEMHGFVRLSAEHGWTIATIIKKTGCSTNVVRSRISWTKLPDHVHIAIRDRLLSIDAANDLARLPATAISQLCGNDQVPSGFTIREFKDRLRLERLVHKCVRRLEDAEHSCNDDDARAAFEAKAKRSKTKEIKQTRCIIDKVGDLDEIVAELPTGSYIEVQPRWGSVTLLINMLVKAGSYDTPGSANVAEFTDLAFAQHEADEQYDAAQDTYLAALDAAWATTLNKKPAELVASVLKAVVAKTWRHGAIIERLGLDPGDDPKQAMADYVSNGAAELARAAFIASFAEPPGFDDKPPRRIDFQADRSLFDDDGSMICPTTDTHPDAEDLVRALNEFHEFKHRRRKMEQADD